MKESNIGPITLITSNPAKIEWAGKFLHSSITHRSLELIEPQSLDLAEIVKYKAQNAFEQIHTPVLVEDVSLVFRAMGKLPGPFIKFFLQELHNEGLCRLADQFSDRSAIASVMYGFHDGKKIHTFDGSISGTIANNPIGVSAGWDPVFVPEGHTKTWAEMDREEFDATSMRAIALTQLNKYLKLHIP